MPEVRNIDTRERILDAAERLFMAHGYEGTSMRQIVDVTDFDRTRVIHTTAQSGHPFHPHYIDFADKWRKIEYIPLLFSADAVRAAAVETLTLTP